MRPGCHALGFLATFLLAIPMAAPLSAQRPTPQVDEWAASAAAALEYLTVEGRIPKDGRLYPGSESDPLSFGLLSSEQLRDFIGRVADRIGRSHDGAPLPELSGCRSMSGERGPTYLCPQAPWHDAIDVRVMQVEKGRVTVLVRRWSVVNVPSRRPAHISAWLIEVRGGSLADVVTEYSMSLVPRDAGT
jgi:hypothetical protein